MNKQTAIVLLREVAESLSHAYMQYGEAASAHWQQIAAELENDMGSTLEASLYAGGAEAYYRRNVDRHLASWKEGLAVYYQVCEQERKGEAK